MRKIFALLAVAILLASCGTARYANNDNYYVATGTAKSVDRDIAWDKAYENAINKVNLKNGIAAESSSVREYDSHTNDRGKATENVRYGELMNTKSHMSAYDIQVKNEKVKSVKNGYECTLTVLIPKENVE